MAGCPTGPYPRQVRIRRFLMLWVAALLIAGAGGVLGASGGAEVGGGQALVAGAQPGAEVLGDLAAEVVEPAPAAAGPASAPATTAAPASSTSVTRPAPTAPRPRSPAPSALAPVTVVVDKPPTGRPVPDGTGRMPCIVEVDLTIGGRLKTGVAHAGDSGVTRLKNCRPLVGDVVSVAAGGASPFGITQVAFGDGSYAGLATARCNPVIANLVETEHRYARAGRYLLEATTRFPCTPDAPIVHRIEIEVADGAVPQAPGAAPCHGLGPVKPGEPPRQGIGTRSFDDPRIGPVDVRLMRCAVPLGQQSEVYLWWFQAQAVVDWGVGTPPEAIGRAGQQGASSIHTHTTRGQRVVKVSVLGADGTPGPPLAFTLLVT